MSIRSTKRANGFLRAFVVFACSLLVIGFGSAEASFLLVALGIPHTDWAATALWFLPFYLFPFGVIPNGGWQVVEIPPMAPWGIWLAIALTYAWIERAAGRRLSSCLLRSS